MSQQNLIQNPDNDYKRGISFQRERFKSAKTGTGSNNFDLMCDSLENIKSDIKIKSIKIGNSKVINRIEKIINWYRTLETKYSKKTENGIQVIYPRDIEYKINHNLTVAYELLIEQLELLELL